METQEEDDEEQEQEQEQEHDSSSSSRRRRRSGNNSNNKKRSKTKRKRKAACTACHARCAAAMHNDNDNDNDNDNNKTKTKMKTKKSKREWPSLRFMAMLQFPRCHYSLKIGIRTAEKLAEKGYRRRRRRRGEGEGEGEGDEGVKVFVEGPAEGEVWPLNLSVKRRCFNRGWRHFVEANGLGHGDILLFTQICESHLAVRVFSSPAGHEKMFFPSPSPLRRLSAGVRFRFHYHDNSCSSSNNNNDTSAAKYDDDIVAFSSYPSTTTTKPRRKMQLLTLTSQERKNRPPEFAVQLTESAVSKAYRISVPSKFAKQWMPQKATQLQLIFLESNKIWTVDFKLYERFKGFHWRDCALSNNLNLGDTCIFKLVNTEQYIFEVNVIKPIIPCSYTSTEEIKPGSNALMVHG